MCIRDRGARTEAWFYVHNKIHEVEHENVGVEGAHTVSYTHLDVYKRQAVDSLKVTARICSGLAGS